jgi:hypothetical protein
LGHRAIKKMEPMSADGNRAAKWRAKRRASGNRQGKPSTWRPTAPEVCGSIHQAKVATAIRLMHHST